MFAAWTVAVVSIAGGGLSNSGTTVGDWIVGGGGLAMALALLRVGTVVGRTSQMLADHQRRLNDHDEDIRDLQANVAASRPPALRPRRQGA